jgi:predicted Zn finger-like uncharacterized protein
MIINCTNCNKRFKINTSLIPPEGRDLKCGFCNHVWFHKIEDKKSEPLPLKEDFSNNEDKSVIVEKKTEQIIKTKQSLSQNKIDNKDEKYGEKVPSKNKAKKNTIGKFFSYLSVSLISFVALIVLVDTLKIPLINIFPSLEIVLFNLFEILKDIKLFIIDLY